MVCGGRGADRFTVLMGGWSGRSKRGKGQGKDGEERDSPTGREIDTGLGKKICCGSEWREGGRRGVVRKQGKRAGGGLSQKSITYHRIVHR